MTFLGPTTAARRPLPRHIALVSAALILVVTFIVLAPRPSSIDLTSITRVVDASVPASTPLASAEPSSEDSHEPETPAADIDRVSNNTLGFSKVFVIGLPERSDKRDAIALSSALTGFHVEWVDGVKGEDIPDKALPFGVEREKLWNTNLGSWRGHMTAVRR